ncbi:MAG: hypothetical protein WB810_13850 [Candidatus Cybelea sp.]
MPGINLRFTREVKCAGCGEALGTPGAYATLRDEGGAIILFNDREPGGQLAIGLHCSKGHRTQPEGCTLEYWGSTPRDAVKAPAKAVAHLL